MGSESGGSAVDSVAGEHSGNVAWDPDLLGQRVGTKWESLPGCWDSFQQRESFGDSLKASWNSFDLTLGVSSVQ